MQTNFATQTESNFKRRTATVQTAGVALVAFTLAATSLPEYPKQLYDRIHLKPVTQGSSSNTTSVAAFADATSDYDRQITARLMDLRVAAQEDQMPWSQASADTLKAFLSFYPKPHRPTIVLTDAGNLAAIWESGRDRHIALQFLELDLVQYTLLSRRPGAQTRSNTSGRDTLAGVLQQITAMGLQDLLTG